MRILLFKNYHVQYDQALGRRFNEGVELSGGEWQKIALARAYMKDAQLLILDEPTAALDARAEYEVFQRFADLTKGKSAVLISHRFSTVRMADRILVLDRGELLEIGSHEELLAMRWQVCRIVSTAGNGVQVKAIFLTACRLSPCFGCCTPIFDYQNQPVQFCILPIVYFGSPNTSLHEKTFVFISSFIAYYIYFVCTIK